MSGNAPKILVVVLVVVALLFFGGVLIGANNGVGGFSLDSAISAFSGLVPVPALDADEITSDCFDEQLQRITVPNLGGCALQIAESSAVARSLKLEIAGGQSVHFELSGEPVEGKSLTIKTDLPKDGNRQTTLTIFASGGTLVLSQCSGGSACILDVVR